MEKTRIIKLLGAIMTIIGIVFIAASLIFFPFTGPGSQSMPLSSSSFHSVRALVNLKNTYTFPDSFYIETKAKPSRQTTTISPSDTQIMTLTYQSGLYFHKSYIYKTELTEEEYDQVISQPEVIAIWEVPEIKLIDNEWSFSGNMADAKKSTRVTELVATGNNGKGTIIVIIDNFPTETEFYSYFPSEWSTRVIHYPANPDPGAEHGIMTASISAEIAPDAELYLIDYRIDPVTNFDTVQNIKNLYPNHQIICSNSYVFVGSSYYNSDDPVNRKILETAKENIIVLFAAGNFAHEGEHDGRWLLDVGYDRRACMYGRDAEIGYPAAFNHVISVAGCASDGRSIVSYSSLGRGIGNNDEPDVAVPTHFTYGNSPYGGSLGTSGSCPFMAGICANVLTDRDAETLRMVGTIHSQSTDRGYAGFDDEFGYGVVDAVKLYEGYPNWIPSIYEAPSPYLIFLGIGLTGIGYVAQKHDEIF